MKLNVVDLFAGCGGFSSGFKKAGFNILVANEFWKPAQLTYEKNHKRTKLIKGDISLEETKNELLDEIGENKVHVLIGGPPCQAFSMAGKRDPNDPRAKLYIDYLDLLRRIEPECFIMENVKGLLSAKNEKGELVVDLIKKGIEELGYKINLNLYNASEYGIPQARERVIITGFKDSNSDLMQYYQELSKVKKQKTVEETIGDLAKAPENFLPNHTFSNHSEKFKEKIIKTQIGKSIYDTFADAYHKCNPNKPCRTVKDNHGSVFLHYSEPRVMTARELARLQTFDDKFEFLGHKREILKQIGNAVPPELARKIALNIKSIFEQKQVSPLIENTSKYNLITENNTPINQILSK